MSRINGPLAMLGLAALLVGCSAAEVQPTVAQPTNGPTATTTQPPTGIPTPHATQTAAPRPSVLSTAPVDTPIDAGTYEMPLDYTPTRFTMDVPEGWSTNQGYLFAGGNETVQSNAVKFATWSELTHVFGDICSVEELVPAGESADEFIAALASQGNREIAGPDDITVDGHEGRTVALKTPSDLDCDSPYLRVWPDPGPDLDGGFLTFRGRTDKIIALDINDARLVMIVSYSDDAGQNHLDELDALVSSIHFVP
ncbi:MAG: hypothetical protein ACXWDE_12345 [Aeromicrobium sp.]